MPEPDEIVSPVEAKTRARNEAKKANTLSISNTKLAACLAALGFPSDCQPTMNVATDRTVREFVFQPRSVRSEYAHLSLGIADLYLRGVLEQEDPMHPLCVMMRAQHNYDRLQDMHRGAVMNLRSVKIGDNHPLNGVMTIYRRGSQLDPRTYFSPEQLQPQTDMALVAAIAGVGLPVLSMDGGDRTRRYHLPRYGYVLKRADGTTYLEDGQLLVARAPTHRDPFRLQLEDTNPMHPVVLGYDALFARSVLKDLLNNKAPLLMVKAGGMQAKFTSNATGRVLTRLTEVFGAPPI